MKHSLLTLSHSHNFYTRIFKLDTGNTAERLLDLLVTVIFQYLLFCVFLGKRSRNVHVSEVRERIITIALRINIKYTKTLSLGRKVWGRRSSATPVKKHCIYSNHVSDSLDN